MTIKERAKRYHQRMIAKNPQAEAWGFDAAYEQGATEQRTIDIEKACEWFRKENSHACKEWLDYECEKLRAAMLND